MFTCYHCGAKFTEERSLCASCGARFASPGQEIIPPQPGLTSNVSSPDQATARGLGRIFGLHPGIAFFTVAVNLMLFGKDGLALVLAPITGGADLPVALAASMVAGAVVGYITYLGQKKWFADDHESAKIKGLITGVLTAIPTGLPGVLFGSAALMGLLWRKKS